MNEFSCPDPKTQSAWHKLKQKIQHILQIAEEMTDEVVRMNAEEEAEFLSKYAPRQRKTNQKAEEQ